MQSDVIESDNKFYMGRPGHLQKEESISEVQNFDESYVQSRRFLWLQGITQKFAKMQR